MVCGFPEKLVSWRNHRRRINLVIRPLWHTKSDLRTRFIWWISGDFLKQSGILRIYGLINFPSSLWAKAALLSGCAFISHLFHRNFRLKSLLKEVKTKLQTEANRGVERRRKRVFRKLVATKRLGHGKFEEYKEPVLLPSEIKGDLRSLKPQGNILSGKFLPWFNVYFHQI